MSDFYENFDDLDKTRLAGMFDSEPVVPEPPRGSAHFAHEPLPHDTFHIPANPRPVNNVVSNVVSTEHQQYIANQSVNPYAQVNGQTAIPAPNTQSSAMALARTFPGDLKCRVRVKNTESEVNLLLETKNERINKFVNGMAPAPITTTSVKQLETDIVNNPQRAAQLENTVIAPKSYENAIHRWEPTHDFSRASEDSSFGRSFSLRNYTNLLYTVRSIEGAATTLQPIEPETTYPIAVEGKEAYGPGLWLDLDYTISANTDAHTLFERSPKNPIDAIIYSELKNYYLRAVMNQFNYSGIIRYRFSINISAVIGEGNTYMSEFLGICVNRTLTNAGLEHDEFGELKTAMQRSLEQALNTLGDPTLAFNINPVFYLTVNKSGQLRQIYTSVAGKSVPVPVSTTSVNLEDGVYVVNLSDVDKITGELKKCIKVLAADIIADDTCLKEIGCSYLREDVEKGVCGEGYAQLTKESQKLKTDIEKLNKKIEDDNYARQKEVDEQKKIADRLEMDKRELKDKQERLIDNHKQEIRDLKERQERLVDNHKQEVRDIKNNHENMVNKLNEEINEYKKAEQNRKTNEQLKKEIAIERKNLEAERKKVEESSDVINRLMNIFKAVGAATAALAGAIGIYKAIKG